MINGRIILGVCIITSSIIFMIFEKTRKFASLLL